MLEDDDVQTVNNDAPEPAPEIAEPPVEGDEADDTPEEVEDFEYEGQKAKLPKRLAEALKPALMRQADYTKKTEEVAAERKANEAERARLEAQAEQHKTVSKDRLRLATVDEQLDTYRKVDWDTLRANNPELAQQHWQRFTLLKDEADVLKGTINEAEKKHALDLQQSIAKKAQQADQILARDIKGWSTELVTTLTRYAADEFGVSLNDPLTMTNPSVWKVIHRAYVGDQLAKKAADAARKAQAQEETPAQPAPQVGARRGAPSNRLRDDDDIKTWMKKRESQLQRG